MVIGRRPLSVIVLVAALLVVPVAGAGAGSLEGAQAPADTTPPALSRMKVDPKVASRAARETLLTFTLSETATVRGSIVRRWPGRRNTAGKCVSAKVGARAHGELCTRRATVGNFTVSAAPGVNRARLSVRRLPLGSYTLLLTPADPAGNTGAVRTVTFRVDP
ncbi:unannotated protein [freshwater metagenome]|uniref:Unannotated protein n=1 Tax=freshwater metagenome TaxID=449393 RepID=A0A6J7CXQ2_9ZZZZ|nr:hypothetical protein [Actinomycetota bacterium]